MPDSRLSRALDECLARIKAGEDIHACLADYPAQARELRPLLAAAARLSGQPAVALAAETRVRNRARLVATIGRAEASGWRQPRLSGSTLRRMVMVPTVAIAVLLALFLGFRSSQAPDSASAATILTVLQGDVRVETAGGQVVARSGMQVKPGDRISTLAGARAVLTFADGSTITLASETVVVIRSVVDDSGQVRVNVSQPQGNTWTYVPAEVGSAKVEIDTPTANVQTNVQTSQAAFSTSVDTTGRTQVGAQDGALAVTSGGRSTNVGSGSETTVSTAGVVSAPTVAETPPRELVIKISGPALAYVTDPAAATVGVLAPGISVNQVANATVTRIGDEIVVKIPNPEDGIFNLGVQGQSVGDVSITATLSGGSDAGTIALTANDKFAVGISISGNDVQVGSPSKVSSVEPAVPAGVSLPGKVVEKAQATATAATPVPTNTLTRTPTRTSTPPSATSTPPPTSTPSPTATSTVIPSPIPSATPRPPVATPVRVPSNIDEISQEASPLGPANLSP